MAINRQKISQMTPKGADLDPTDLIEVSVDTGTGYETRSITGQEIINGASGNFVPYTGATQDVDLDANKLSAESIYIEGTNGNGHLHLKHQNADATATGQSTALWANNDGDIKWKNDGDYKTTLKTSSNTADRVYTFPDADCTLVPDSRTITINGTTQNLSSNITFTISTGLTVGTTPVTSGTNGRVFFQAGGVVQQDADLFWDNTNKRLGIGKSPAATSAKAVIAITDGTANTNHYLTLRNLAGGFGSWGFVKSGSNDLAITYETNVDAPSLGTSLRFYYGGTSAFASSLSVGTLTTPGARLDVRAQGALSTDIAFRVRNSADTLNVFDVNGLGEANIKVGNQNLLYINSTAGESSKFTGQNFIANTTVSGIGVGRTNMVLINAANSEGSFVAGTTHINTNAGVATKIQIGTITTNSSIISINAGTSQIGYNLNCNTNLLSIGANMSWTGGGTSNGMIAIGNNPQSGNGNNLVNGYANAIVLGINQVDFVIGGGKGNIGINFNPTGRTETNTIFVKSGTAPTASIVDGFQQYSADITAGNAAPHFRTETGDVIKLYKETTAVTAATRVGGAGTNITDTDTFDGYTVSQIVKALRNLGILA